MRISSISLCCLGLLRTTSIVNAQSQSPTPEGTVAAGPFLKSNNIFPLHPFQGPQSPTDEAEESQTSPDNQPAVSQSSSDSNETDQQPPEGTSDDDPQVNQINPNDTHPTASQTEGSDEKSQEAAPNFDSSDRVLPSLEIPDSWKNLIPCRRGRRCLGRHRQTGHGQPGLGSGPGQGPGPGLGPRPRPAPGPGRGSGSGSESGSGPANQDGNNNPPPQLTPNAPSPKTPIGQGTSGLSQVCLTEHNDLRRKKRAQDLTWSQPLAQSAQAWANRCKFAHGGMGENTGQNIAAYTEKGATRGIKMWSDEERVWDEGNQNFEGYGHYTQMVWKSTQELGCAIAECNGIFEEKFWPVTFLVCNYVSAGNIYPISNFYKNIDN